MKQILQISAILPGQSPHRQFNIPSRNNSLTRVPTRSTIHSQVNPENPRQSEPQLILGDLIDLSDSTPQPQQQQQQPPPPPKKQPTSSKEDDLMAGIPPSKLLHSNSNRDKQQPSNMDLLRRMDSETQEEEEFHDALT